MTGVYVAELNSQMQILHNQQVGMGDPLIAAITLKETGD